MAAAAQNTRSAQFSRTQRSARAPYSRPMATPAFSCAARGLHGARGSKFEISPSGERGLRERRARVPATRTGCLREGRASKIEISAPGERRRGWRRYTVSAGLHNGTRYSRAARASKAEIPASGEQGLPRLAKPLGRHN
ncbi:hypothetical protein PsYK624_171310 [Phanerochaete sordida]|uniref:Uncharacterized protein n=1 Tax=Phanerochaete sordida TaxID=48140 RepID=A0A9P3LMG6_9APHY|nr:hypothetical protein PsYK624_171310 [Phanerochaete sordida]